MEQLAHNPAVVMQRAAQALDAAADKDAARLLTLDPRQRGALLESACEAAAAICRSRRAAGLPEVEPAPWPPSTWAFLRQQAARVRT